MPLDNTRLKFLGKLVMGKMLAIRSDKDALQAFMRNLVLRLSDADQGSLFDTLLAAAKAEHIASTDETAADAATRLAELEAMERP